MVFIDFDPRYKHFELKRKKTTTERLQEGIDESQRLDKDRKLPFIPQVPVLPSMISMNNPYDVYHGSLVPIGSIYPNEENKPSFPIPREKIPPSVGNHASVVTEPVTPQEQNSKPEPSFWDKLSRFSQSDVSKNIDDFLMGAITASPDSSGWQLFAKGLKNLHEGDKQRGQVNQTVEYLKSKGYSEEEAAVMARNPQMLSALLTGGDTPKLPLGHQWYINPETGEREARPIKGSLLELEYNQKKRDIEEWEIGKRNTAAVVAKEINHIVDTVNNALQIIEKNPKKAAGKVGAFAQIIPGADAKTLKNKLKTLEGGVFVRVIEAIKKQSDGGKLGVGPLSNEESRRIVASYGTMDISDKPEELYKTLLKIKDMFDLFKKLNDEEIYRLSNGMEVRPRLKYSAQYANQSMSQGGSENIPRMSMQEAAKRNDITEFIDIETGEHMRKVKL
ncbi:MULTISPECIES: hypothetical protein [unclassified Bartonella]|uniref:hypothetical protein n=1 Tax=unclassified Bartonella TaxID=2645622 RepID=UPI0035CFC31D